MKTLWNYIGQLRIYSLIDLALLLVAVEATSREFIGILCLHISFLAYLESRHSHNGRNTVPKWLWAVFILVGVCFYQKIEAIPFLIASFFYTKKTSEKWGLWSPFFRGFQFLVLLAGIAGYGDLLPWLAFLVGAIRNAIGDVRDVEKDQAVGMKTLPILFGITKNIKFGHLVAMTLSTTIWWNFSCLSVWVLLLALLVQFATYNLTPR